MLIKDESGLALPLTIIIVVVLTIIGIVFMNYSMAETGFVARDENNMKAHYIARSGAHAVAADILEKPESVLDLLDSGPSVPVNFAGGQFEVIVYGDPYENIYVESIGSYNNASQKVIATIRNTGVDFPLYGNTINISGVAASIYGGDVLYGLLGGNNYNDSIIKEGESYNFFREFDEVILPCADPESVFYPGGCPPYSSDPFPYGIPITESVAYNEIIKLGGQNKLLSIDAGAGQNILFKANEIDLGNNDMNVDLNGNTVAIVTDKLSSSGNSKITISNTSQEDSFLLFYVDTFEIGGSFQLIEGDSDIHVNVLVKNGGLFDISGTPNFKGVVYAPDADVRIGGHGSGSFEGWIISEEMTGLGNVEIKYVPVKLGQTSIDLDLFRLINWRYDS